MEVLMRKLFSAFLSISFIAVFGAATAYGQVYGLRVSADVPFDFAVGDSTFAAGKYEMLLTSNNGSVYTVSLFNENRKQVMGMTAIRIGSTSKDSDLLFANDSGAKFLEKLRTPDMGFQFVSSKKERLLALAKRTSVPTTTAAPSF
jgi:hypothetical protein